MIQLVGARFYRHVHNPKGSETKVRKANKYIAGLWFSMSGRERGSVMFSTSYMNRIYVTSFSCYGRDELTNNIRSRTRMGSVR